jgi:anti-sigma factor RsiW
MTELRGQPSAGPAWGGHLALDAIVAYVDEELSPGAHRRALEHLSRCSECAAEVIAQTQARVALRGSIAPRLPSSLLSSLRAIPTDTELPEPPAGLAVSSDGELVAMLRDPARPSRRRPVDRRVRLGAGAVVTGLALGGLMIAGNGAAPSNVPTTASFGGGSSTIGENTLGGTVPVAGVAPTQSAPRPVLDSRQDYGPRYGSAVVRGTSTPTSSAPPAPPGPLHAHG